jgi:hypothetical protein
VSINCCSVVAYGHILTEEEYYLLEEKFNDYLWENLEENNGDYSCHLIRRDSYSDEKHQNYFLGDEVIYVSAVCFAPVGNCLSDEDLEKEIQDDIEKILGYHAECNYYAFTKWW